MGEVQRRNVAAQMMHGNQRFVCAVSNAFGEIQPHKHRADQAGCKRHGNTVDVGKRAACIVQRFLCHLRDVLDMAAAGDFGHNTAV